MVYVLIRLYGQLHILLWLGLVLGCNNDKGVNGEEARELVVELPGGSTMEFVWIEPGTFMMGSPQDGQRRGHEPGRTRRQLRLSAGPRALGYACPERAGHRSQVIGLRLVRR